MNVGELVLAKQDLEAGATGFALLTSAYGVGLIGGALCAGRDGGDARVAFFAGLGGLAAGMIGHGVRAGPRLRAVHVRLHRRRQRPVLHEQDDDAAPRRPGAAARPRVRARCDSLDSWGFGIAVDRRRRADHGLRRPRAVRGRRRAARAWSSPAPRSRCAAPRLRGQRASARLIASLERQLRALGDRGLEARVAERGAQRVLDAGGERRPRRAGGSSRARARSWSAAPHSSAPVCGSAARARRRCPGRRRSPRRRGGRARSSRPRAAARRARSRSVPSSTRASERLVELTCAGSPTRSGERRCSPRAARRPARCRRRRRGRARGSAASG